MIQSQDLLDAQGELTQSRIEKLDAIVSYRRQLVDLRVASMAELSELAP